MRNPTRRWRSCPGLVFDGGLGACSARFGRPWESAPTARQFGDRILQLDRHPPSLVFLLFFVGINLLLLSFWHRVAEKSDGWPTFWRRLDRCRCFTICFTCFCTASWVRCGSVAVGSLAMTHGGGFGTDSFVRVVSLYRRFKSKTAADSIWRFF